ncbi:unnamed protein product [Prorocentrum cordatum]|uniref:Uncharacterized protein n=1 Tax=Prorocentrum cordatum TaxID=2364126 RepID=A0ABN9SAU0_9DINO|nr:unnamed protein product [Polarella glacialis]
MATASSSSSSSSSCSPSAVVGLPRRARRMGQDLSSRCFRTVRVPRLLLRPGPRRGRRGTAFVLRAAPPGGACLPGPRRRLPGRWRLRWRRLRWRRLRRRRLRGLPGQVRGRGRLCAGASAGSGGPARVLAASRWAAEAAGAPPAGAAPAAPAEPPRGQPGALRAILADVGAAESEVWRAAFERAAGGRAAVPMDCAGVRDLVTAHSGISEQDLDTELIRVASRREDLHIDAHGFAALLRGSSMSDGEALERFIELSANGDTVTAEQCRDDLLAMTRSKLGAQAEAADCEQIVAAAMPKSGAVVSMEEFVNCAKLVARILRVARYTGAL